MAKVAIIVLADTETHAGLARVTNALTAAKEFKESGDDVKLVFDGAATAWIPKLAEEDHDLHDLFEEVRETLSGACSFCAEAFEVKELIQRCNVRCLNEYEGHPSLRRMMEDGYQMLTF